MKKWLILKSILIILPRILLAKFSGKKIIIFHHPNKNLMLNTDYYIKNLFNKFKKRYLIFYTHESQFFKKKNYFFMSQWYLKFILGVDFFISTYVCDNFTLNSKKIYIHHDIYDTPISKNSNKKNVILKIKKYDFIFVSSFITKIMFEKLFKKLPTEKNPVIEITGYSKLDHLLNKVKKNKIKPENLIIAPTNIKAFGQSYLIKKLPKIVKKLIKLNYKVVLRPHPSNIRDDKFLKIKKQFIKEKNFFLNNDKNYLSIYLKSYCMITDISGTAYTYAFLTNRPVIFFEKTKKTKIRKKLYFFKDRNKVGKICYSVNNLISIVKNIKKNSIKYKLMITSLKKSRLSNLGNVNNYIFNFIGKK